MNDTDIHPLPVKRKSKKIREAKVVLKIKNVLIKLCTRLEVLKNINHSVQGTAFNIDKLKIWHPSQNTNLLEYIV